MQFLKITAKTTLTELAKRVGDKNVDSVLAANNLKRTPNIGKAFKAGCDAAIASTKPVTWEAKSNILNTLTGEGDAFETAALGTEDDWKLLQSVGTLPNTLKLPETLTLPDATDITGGSGVGVSTLVYQKVMTDLQSPMHTIDPSIFNQYSTTLSSPIKQLDNKQNGSNIYNMFKLPWGKITLYSSLSGESMDFPVYPEEYFDDRSATYTTMPDVLYQYEPWYTYQSSGPRQNSYTFKFHRDMWTGDHRDGNANKLIRFCEANCYPEYNGSAVYTSTVSLYISGKKIISGIMTKCETKWDGPLGLDDWYLVCELTLNITEVSAKPLNYSTVRSMGLIGDN